MKFKIKVKNEKMEWWEDYDKNVYDAREYAEQMVEAYNTMRRPSELARELLDVVELDDVPCNE